MNNFAAPILWIHIMLLSPLDIQGEKEWWKAYFNFKDIDTRLSQMIFINGFFQMLFLKRILRNLLFYDQLAIGRVKLYFFQKLPCVYNYFEHLPDFIRSIQLGWTQGLILEACLFTWRLAISENWMRSFQYRVLRETTIFYYNEELPKVYYSQSKERDHTRKKHFQTNQFECLIFFEPY